METTDSFEIALVELMISATTVVSFLRISATAGLPSYLQACVRVRVLVCVRVRVPVRVCVWACNHMHGEGDAAQVRRERHSLGSCGVLSSRSDLQQAARTASLWSLRRMCVLVLVLDALWACPRTVSPDRLQYSLVRRQMTHKHQHARSPAACRLC